MKILTNMAFWQSQTWLDRVDSIYTLTYGGGDPAHIPWWKEAWQLFLRRKDYDVILSMGVRESFLFATLCWLTRSDCCHVMTEIFIDAPKSSNPIWRLKTGWYRRMARRTAGIITNTTAEIITNSERYDLPRDHFQYVPLNTTIDNPEYIGHDEGYLFCAGRTLRDYRTLVKVIERTAQPWVIVAGKQDMLDCDLPDRVTIHREIDRGAYLELLRNASAVILPLLRTGRATGQVVVLEAMSYGKVVITTDAPGTRDIIRDGENGFLVQPEAPDEIVQRLKAIQSDDEKKKLLGRQALTDIETVFSTEEHTRLRIEAIERLWQRARSR